MNMITPNPNLLKSMLLCCVKIINPIALNTIAFEKTSVTLVYQASLPLCY